MAKNKEAVIKILMNRDDELTEEVAKMMVDNCCSELYDAMYGTSNRDPEDVVREELDLDPKYMYYLM
jgi:hypothetical protein